MYHLRSPNMVTNNRTILEVSSPIKIQSTPRPGLVQSLIPTGYSSGLK